MEQDLAIYCVCFPRHEPLKQQRHQVNIMCNAASISSQYRQRLARKGFVFDDEGDNISLLNWTLGDLTASYWIWRNSPHEYVGTSQYRRFWDDRFTQQRLDDNTLYVQQPIQLGNKSLREQYIHCHGELGISILDELSQSNKIPLTPAMLDKAYALDYLYGCNMFVAHKPLYDKFCEILFEVVFTIHEVYGDRIKALDSYNRRTPAFLAERVVTAIIANRDDFLSGVNIVPVKWDYKKRTLFQKLKFSLAKAT